MSSILALRVTLPEPLNATAEAVMSPDIAKFLLLAKVVDVSALPTTSPVKPPTKAVEVIEVAPVTTPASITIVSSNTICCPVSGVSFKSVPAVDVIELPFILILSTCNAVRVPTDVIAVCAEPVTVDAVPDVLPVTLPVRFPTNAVDVIDVAPVTTPASITIAPSKTICCPANGVIFKSVPAVEDMVFPLIFMLSTCKAVNVPRLVILPCAAVCIVPVKLPTTLPSILATKVAV